MRGTVLASRIGKFSILDDDVGNVVVNGNETTAGIDSIKPDPIQRNVIVIYVYVSAMGWPDNG